MLFNSFTFLVFFLAFFAGYWFVFKGNLKLQNAFIVLGGVVFYGWWDWRFLFLLFFSTLLGFVAARLIYHGSQQKSRKVILIATILINLGLLFFFKYFNFFIQSLVDIMRLLDIRSDVTLLKIILPIGISFYTFQKLSYVIDVYNKRIKPSDDFLQFAAYVSFFPQLLAGPIERATHLLPQFSKPRKFDQKLAIDGLGQIIYGLFKKIVVADNCAIFVNTLWGDYQSHSGLTLVLAAVFFAFQIYGDFSGYTDIAAGCAKLLGLELMINFRYPYLSRSVSEFWKRWHISLSSWFRDYVYFSLGGSKGSKLKTIRNVFVIFLISGIWHGANWTFVIWGIINAAFFMPGIFIRSQETSVVAEHSLWPSVKEFLQMAATFAVICLGWVFFRSDTVTQAISFLERCFDFNVSLKFFLSTNTYRLVFAITCLAIMQLMAIDWLNRRNDFVKFKHSVAMSCLLIVEICFMGSYKNHFEFIYFQF